jgi:hypothetical protein
MEAHYLMARDMLRGENDKMPFDPIWLCLVLKRSDLINGHFRGEGFSW